MSHHTGSETNTLLARWLISDARYDRPKAHAEDVAGITPEGVFKLRHRYALDGFTSRLIEIQETPDGTLVILED